jgi:uncharacterized membrane protein required for colicin V production
MLFDVIIVLIAILFAFIGFKNGIIYTVFHAVGWLCAIAAAWLLAPKANEFLTEKTAVDDKISEKAADLMGAIPGQASTPIADTVTSTAMSVISFIAVLVAVKIILFLITFLISRKYRGGFVGGIDGVLGGILGIACATTLICVILLIITPASYLISNTAAEWTADQLNRSMIAYNLHEHNPLNALIKNYTPEMLTTGYWQEKITDKYLRFSMSSHSF